MNGNIHLHHVPLLLPTRPSFSPPSLSVTSVHQIIKQYSTDLRGPACVTHAKSITHEEKFPCLWIPSPLRCPLHHHWKKTRSWTSQMVSFSSSLSPGPPRRTAHKHKQNTPSSQHQQSLLSASLHTSVCFVQRASSLTNALPYFQITLLSDHHQRHYAEAEILERQSSALFLNHSSVRSSSTSLYRSRISDLQQLSTPLITKVFPSLPKHRESSMLFWHRNLVHTMLPSVASTTWKWRGNIHQFWVGTHFTCCKPLQPNWTGSQDNSQLLQRSQADTVQEQQRLSNMLH